MKKSLFFSHSLVIVCLILLFQANIFAQKGYPYISPFSFDESIENDNFDILQDNNNNILIANRKGLLTFDSRNWELLPLQYFPVVLSKSPSDGAIYAGCRNGFGSLSKDVNGDYIYEILSDTLFTGEIAEIRSASKSEYFIARNQVYIYSSATKKLNSWVFPYENEITGSFVFKDEFYFLVSDRGLYLASDDTFKLVLSDVFTKSSELIFSFETNSKELIVGASDNGMYLFTGSGFKSVYLKDAEYLKTSIITDGLSLEGSEIAIGTLMGGVIICDYKSGLTSSIINYKTGLPDDEIYCLTADNNHGLWVCHPFGASRIDNKLNIANLTWYTGLNGNLTNTAFFEGKLYIGTSDGVYALQEKREYTASTVYAKSVPKALPTETVSKNSQAPPSKSTEQLSRREQRKKRREAKSEPEAISTQKTGLLERIFNTVENPTRVFDRKGDSEAVRNTRKKVYSLQAISHAYEKISGIKGKCTEILVINDHLLISTYSGLYDFYNNQVFPVLTDKFISFINPGLSDKIIFAGTGESVYILALSENRWEVIREFDNLNYPVYSASMTSSTELWLGSDNAAHKLTINSRYISEKDESFLITTKFSDKVILRTINQKLYFFMSSGIFLFENNQIKPLKTFDRLSSLPGYYFSGNNVVWYRTSDRWDCIPEDTGGNAFPGKFLNVFQSVQDVYLGKNGDIYVIANNQEVFHILKEKDQDKPDGFSVFFSGLKGTDDQLFPLVKPKISYGKSSLRIDFSAPYYIAPGKTEFSYKIQGLNNTWSTWSNASTIEYPLLPPGNYTIQAKARNIFGKESEISTLEIIIKPPFWKTKLFYLLMLIIVFSLFALFVKFREQNLRKAKEILEQKVKERTAEIEMQKNEIAEQKKEITDSIFYARRIQSAILPSTSMLTSVLSEHFVLFLPKDIVSGDFYWSFVKGDKIVILAADCTGHGVPGAFMSMLGVSFLNEIVNAHKLDSAASILNELRDHVKATLAQSGSAEHARDGMDISLCIIDQKKSILQYAGAYNPLYMIRSEELTEIKADKMPIGWYDLDTEFTNNIVNLRKGDCFYIFSDGFSDQFGGEFGKKYLSKPFKNFLLKIHGQPMTKQKEMLFEEFENWKGKLHQVDDVLVIGFRI
jgi:serine phosphatase RsbU (regulator of sigma subunit)